MRLDLQGVMINLLEANLTADFLKIIFVYSKQHALCVYSSPTFTPGIIESQPGNYIPQPSLSYCMKYNLQTLSKC